MIDVSHFSVLEVPDVSPLDAALAYGRAGLRVVPVWWVREDGRCACKKRECRVDRDTGKVHGAPGKHPIERAWQKLATSDEATIRAAWERHPRANIGIATGGPERLLAVDVDGEVGRTSLERLLAGRDLPPTLTSRSGRVDGGNHYLYTVPEAFDFARLGNRASVNGFEKIDTRAEGGQFVAAPSLHVSGNRYAWEYVFPVAELPEWMFEALAAPIPAARPAPSSGTLVAVPSFVRSSSNPTDVHPYIATVIDNACRDVAALPEGNRNSVLAAKARTVFEYLTGASLDRSVADERLAQAGIACGLPEAEVRSVLAKAWANQGPPKVVPPPSRSSAPPPSSEGWRSLLERDESKKGEPLRNSLGNAIVFLSHEEWDGVLAYDEFGACVVKLRPPPVRPQDAPTGGGEAGDWTDDDTRRTVAWLGKVTGKDFHILTVENAIHVVARKQTIHPVRAWLESLEWDGEPRLDTMLVDCFGVADSAYARGVSSRWTISAVARIMRPGCQADCALVLEGLQGHGKSTGLEALAGQGWFADTGLDLGSKDSYQCLRRKWIYELGELTGVKGKAIERVKAFLSARVDNYRPSFGKRNVDFPRQTVFAATTNETKYLTDPTGNRRFLPVRCVRAIDRARIADTRAQLWAEAVHRFRAGEAWHVDTPEFRALCLAEQEARLDHDPWEESIADWLASPWLPVTDAAGHTHRRPVDLTRGVSTRDVLVGCLGKRIGDVTRADEMRVGESLRRMGFEMREFKVHEGESRKTVRRYLTSSNCPNFEVGTRAKGTGHEIGNDSGE